MGRSSFLLALALGAGCCGGAPERASSLLAPAGGRLAELEGAAGRIVRLSPGARAAMGLRALLLDALRPGRRADLPPDPLDSFDPLQPTLIDVGVFAPGGGALRFPEIVIGRRAPEAADLDVDLGVATPTSCGPAVVGAYRGGAELLVLDAGGGFTLGGGAGRRAGRYSCDGVRLFLVAPGWRRGLAIAADEALTDGAGRRYTALVGGHP